MASVEELQEELVRQSSHRLEAEHERTRIEELWRAGARELAIVKSRNKSLEDENAALAQRVSSMENEIADLSSSLLDQANQQVAEANRRAAAAQKRVEEDQDVISSQRDELLALKQMLQRGEQEKYHVNDARRLMRVASYASGRGDTPLGSPVMGSPLPEPASASQASSNALDNLLAHDLLTLETYASPIRPLMRTDLREFKDFLDLWGVERTSHSTVFAKLETPPWRRPRFVHRVIQEDIEPTLRLDRTPHMSWLSIRAFFNGILDQTLEIEPVSAKERPWALRPSHPCLLCGENRGRDVYARSYWARPAPEADTIVLDLTCVVKTRLACELVGLLRDVAGRAPTDDVEAQTLAWRQCNSMREQLFWARTGGLFPDVDDTLAELQASTRDDLEFFKSDALDPPEPPRTISTQQVVGRSSSSGEQNLNSDRIRPKVLKVPDDAQTPQSPSIRGSQGNPVTAHSVEPSTAHTAQGEHSEPSNSGSQLPARSVSALTTEHARSGSPGLVDPDQGHRAHEAEPRRNDSKRVPDVGELKIEGMEDNRSHFSSHDDDDDAEFHDAVHDAPNLSQNSIPGGWPA